MESLPSLPWGQLSPWALVAIAVVAIFTGRLIPWGTWRAWQSERDARLSEAKEEIQTLRTLNATSQVTIATQAKQIGELLELGRTGAAVLNSLRAEGGARRALVEAEDTDS